MARLLTKVDQRARMTVKHIVDFNNPGTTECLMGTMVKIQLKGKRICVKPLSIVSFIYIKHRPTIFPLKRNKRFLSILFPFSKKYLLIAIFVSCIGMQYGEVSCECRCTHSHCLRHRELLAISKTGVREELLQWFLSAVLSGVCPEKPQYCSHGHTYSLLSWFIISQLLSKLKVCFIEIPLP